MSDQIVGICVLTPHENEPGLYYLLFSIRRAAEPDKRLGGHMVHVREGHGNWPKHGPHNVWGFVRQGSRLNCQPSVLIEGYFHNTFNWTVDYVEMTYFRPAEGRPWPGQVHQELNCDQTPEQLVARLAELRQQGVLK